MDLKQLERTLREHLDCWIAGGGKLLRNLWGVEGHDGVWTAYREEQGCCLLGTVLVGRPVRRGTTQDLMDYVYTSPLAISALVHGWDAPQDTPPAWFDAEMKAARELGARLAREYADHFV
jgi:hypothetical protein